jgi:hypothetical protein
MYSCDVCSVADVPLERLVVVWKVGDEEPGQWVLRFKDVVRKLRPETPKEVPLPVGMNPNEFEHLADVFLKDVDPNKILEYAVCSDCADRIILEDVPGEGRVVLVLVREPFNP